MIKAGELVCNAVYTSPKQKGSSWYLEDGHESNEVIIKMKTVSVPDLKVTVETKKKDLPRDLKMLPLREIEKRRPFKLTDDEKDRIMDENARMERIEYNDTMGETMVDEDDEEEWDREFFLCDM